MIIMKKMKIDANLIPQKKLNTGDKIPVLGLGTFGSDTYSNDQVAQAVKFAVESGYLHIDCASVYGNEKEIGQVISELISEGTVKREDLFITSKVWNNMHGGGNVITSCKQTLSDLQLDYLNLYLVHWPFPNYHAPGCDGTSRNPDSKPYNHRNYMIAWK